GLGGDDTVFDSSGVPLDVHYEYLAGGVGQNGPCASCQSGCNNLGGTWWGCWQDLSQPPGRFVAGRITDAAMHGGIAMFTYYEELQASGAAEGAGEVMAAGNNMTLMRSYLSDWKFLMQTIHQTTSAPVLVHIEPDFWGYAQQVGDPTMVPALVASAAPSDCAGLPDTIAGLGQCMLRIARQVAPNARIGFHASAWAAGPDVYVNTSPSFDVELYGGRVAAFLRAVGAADADFVAVEMSDRDAGLNGRWWDATNATLPNFIQAERFVDKVARDLGVPALWWQIPLGNLALNNTPNHYQDNRLDYFFDHPLEFAQKNAIGIVFGAGAGNCTTASTDGGHFVMRAQSYFQAGPIPICPP
ncbi:MAG TPA: hypothetical protein VKN99_09650, partial [Polyangia bacterium]|nr:hypothetical protein [Polyangia bacterium]